MSARALNGAALQHSSTSISNGTRELAVFEHATDIEIRTGRMFIIGPGFRGNDGRGLMFQNLPALYKTYIFVHLFNVPLELYTVTDTFGKNTEEVNCSGHIGLRF